LLWWSFACSVDVVSVLLCCCGCMAAVVVA
jgi:hypothetical protein